MKSSARRHLGCTARALGGGGGGTLRGVGVDEGGLGAMMAEAKALVMVVA
jgi:hypothetical protein